MLTALRRFPARFACRHPIRTARNLVGNHPSALAGKYLTGLRGIEIGGAAHNDFFLDTLNVDHADPPATASIQLRHAGRIMPVDVVASADALPFDDDAYDFVLASHVIEHLADPIKGLKEWSRVARRYIVMIVPLPTNEYDRDRPLTPLAELVERHQRGFTAADERHWSVWSPTTFSELCSHLGLELAEVQAPDDKRGNGFAVVVDLNAAQVSSC